MSNQLNAADLDLILLYLEGCTDPRSASLCDLIEKVERMLAQRHGLDALIAQLTSQGIDPWGVEITMLIGRGDDLLRRLRGLAQKAKPEPTEEISLK